MASPLLTIDDLFNRTIPEPNCGCWIWLYGLTSEGYGTVRFRGRSRRAHRVSWVLHRGPIPNGAFVCHHCDNPICINPDHLFIGTAADNNKDRRRKGRDFALKNPTAASVMMKANAITNPNPPRGEKNGRAKLTRRVIRSIKRMAANGKFQAEIAARYQVSQSCISLIVTGKRWKLPKKGG